MISLIVSLGVTLVCLRLENMGVVNGASQLVLYPLATLAVKVYSVGS